MENYTYINLIVTSESSTFAHPLHFDPNMKYEIAFVNANTADVCFASERDSFGDRDRQIIMFRSMQSETVQYYPLQMSTIEKITLKIINMKTFTGTYNFIIRCQKSNNYINI